MQLHHRRNWWILLPILHQIATLAPRQTLEVPHEVRLFLYSVDATIILIREEQEKTEMFYTCS